MLSSGIARMDTRQEQSLLKLSILVTLIIGAIGIAFGLWAGSQAIVFDGFYSLVDVAMTAVALLVSKLIAREGSKHFQYGYWHLEPLVNASNGTVLAVACSYAFITAVGNILAGGHAIAFGPGAVYALFAAAVAFVMALYVQRKSRTLDSELLRVDARAWLIGGLLSSGLFISFAIGYALAGTSAAHWTPYVDPLVLMVLTLVLIPLPLSTIWNALRDVFQVAPSDLDAHVRTVLSDVVAHYGFHKYSSYVLKAGRARFIEIHIVTPPDFRIDSVRQLDRVRDDIADRLGQPGSERWLTIAFTTEEKWI
jgi:cation diffusion facilitator family transporter